MFCSHCGNECKDGVSFCPRCGAPVGGGVQGAGRVQQQAPAAWQPAAAPMQPQHASGQSPRGGKPKRKRGRTVLAVLGLVVVAAVVVLTLMALDKLPRFWENGSGDETSDAAAAYVDEENGEPLDDLSGMTPTEAEAALEDQGFKLGEVKTVYSYVADSDGRVAYTEPNEGTKLVDRAKVDLVVVEPVDVREARSFALDANKMSTRIKEDPAFLEGAWTAEHAPDDNTSSDWHSNCDAWKEAPGKLSVEVGEVDPDSGYADVTAVENLALHLHENNVDKARHYDSADDEFASLADLSGSSSPAVFTVAEDRSFFGRDLDGVQWSTELEVDVPSVQDPQPGDTASLAIGLAMYIQTDVDTEDEESLGSLLGDDATAVYDTPEQAYAALADALKARSWVQLTVVQGYDKWSGSVDRAENFKLVKEGSEDTEGGSSEAGSGDSAADEGEGEGEE